MTDTIIPLLMIGLLAINVLILTALTRGNKLASDIRRIAAAIMRMIGD